MFECFTPHKRKSFNISWWQSIANEKKQKWKGITFITSLSTRFSIAYSFIFSRYVIFLGISLSQKKKSSISSISISIALMLTVYDIQLVQRFHKATAEQATMPSSHPNQHSHSHSLSHISTPELSLNTHNPFNNKTSTKWKIPPRKHINIHTKHIITFWFSNWIYFSWVTTPNRIHTHTHVNAVNVYRAFFCCRSFLVSFHLNLSSVDQCLPFCSLFYKMRADISYTYAFQPRSQNQPQPKLSRKTHWGASNLLIMHICLEFACILCILCIFYMHMDQTVQTRVNFKQ